MWSGEGGREREKANVLKCWQLKNLEEGHIGIVCTILTNFLEA